MMACARQTTVNYALYYIGLYDINNHLIILHNFNNRFLKFNIGLIIFKYQELFFNLL